MKAMLARRICVLAQSARQNLAASKPSTRRCHSDKPLKQVTTMVVPSAFGMVPPTDFEPVIFTLKG
jgi:hypothetical protein